MLNMHVIARKALISFWKKHPDAEEALKAWFHEVNCADWRNSADLKSRYRSASIISRERVVFNIGGNKYRLIVRINFASQTVFIRFVGTHREYEKVIPETI